VRRWRVRFGYDGAPFEGWARQPGRRTVEGTILGGLPRCGVASSPAAARLEIASRTDRGVSARANVLALSSDLEGVPLLRALNGIAPEIFFTGAREVDADFRVRAPLWREYRYLLPAGTSDLAAWSELARRFVGQPIDVRSFARGVPMDRPCWRRIDELEILAGDEGPALRIRASGFLWGMVRKIVGALELSAAGSLEPGELDRALNGDLRLPVPMAPAGGLVLWEVEFGSPWEFSLDYRTRHQRRHFDDARRDAVLRARLLPVLFPAGDGPGRSTGRAGSVAEDQ
jgi:tRNA pseudouridine38-40 synthase